MFNRILMSMGMLAADAGTITENVGSEIVKYLNIVLTTFISVAIVIGSIYAIIVGMRMAKANNAEEREEAKKKVIYTVVGIVVALALIIILNIFSANYAKWIGAGKDKVIEDTTNIKLLSLYL